MKRLDGSERNTCPRCGVDRPLSAFHRGSKGFLVVNEDGSREHRHSYCKFCHSDLLRERREARDPEPARQISRDYYARNREQVLARVHRNYHENIELERKIRRARYLARRGGKRRRYLLTDDMLREAWYLHDVEGLTYKAIAQKFWESWGYASVHSAHTALTRAIKTRDFPRVHEVDPRHPRIPRAPFLDWIERTLPMYPGITEFADLIGIPARTLLRLRSEEGARDKLIEMDTVDTALQNEGGTMFHDIYPEYYEEAA